MLFDSAGIPYKSHTRMMPSDYLLCTAWSYKRMVVSCEDPRWFSDSYYTYTSIDILINDLIKYIKSNENV